ncbi:MAG: hypothetical protein COA52_00945 [Hyphomicrobiales bacterium]|nr:MAG: hypothetical protein COA52_00945 [Hyphomicrobiales bacterium]
MDGLDPFGYRCGKNWEFYLDAAEDTLSSIHRDKNMYEIYVPTVSNEGKPFKTKHHKEWDRQVRQITNGLTIYAPAKGQWLDEDSGELFIERMIPVRIACTEEEIYIIMKIVANHYNQIDVLAYEISNNVLFLKDEKGKLQ